MKKAVTAVPALQAIYCLSIRTAKHGQYVYRAIFRYVQGTKKDGTVVWLKDSGILAEATTWRKINILASAMSAETGLEVLNVCHGDSVTVPMSVPVAMEAEK